jgi:cell filamentation protein
MGNDADPDQKYTDKSRGVLINLVGIANRGTLHRLESLETAEKIRTLKRKSPTVNSVEDILKIHKHLFGKIYHWAGELRTVNMSKGTSAFFEVERFGTAIPFLNQQIAKYKAIDRGKTRELAAALALILDTLNYFHPFREGNGRTQRMAIELLAAEKGHALDLNPPDEPEAYERYMKGTIEGDAALLTELIYDRLSRG